MPLPRPKLDRGTIVDGAIALIDEEGFDALTVRRLAARLGVQAPALYWHVADRRALLGAVVETLYARIDAPAGPPNRDALPGWLIDRGNKLRRMLLSIRDSARLVVEAPNDARRATRFRDLAATAQDLSESAVTRSIATLSAFVLGWVHYEQQPAMHQFMASVMDVDAAFETGLRALATGLAAEFAREAAQSEPHAPQNHDPMGDADRRT